MPRAGRQRPRDVDPDGEVAPEDVRALVEASLDMLCLLDATGSPIYVSPASEGLTGYAPAELVGRHGLLTVHPSDRPQVQAALAQLLAGASVRHVYRLLRKDGGTVWVESAGQPTAGQNRFVVVTRDVTEQVHRQAQLRFDAQHDPLTSLSNRQLAAEEITAAIARAQRSGQPMALLYIDLDEFKSINDRYGHLAGDAVLKSVANRLRTSVRRGDLVARLGGDEFVVLMENLPVPPEPAVHAATSKLERVLADAHRAGDRVVSASGSIGAAIWQDDQDTEALLARADGMMYRTKHAWSTADVQ